MPDCCVCNDCPVCAQVTDNKQRISELKSAIEQRRVQRSMASLAEAAGPQESDSVEESAKAQIEQVSSAVIEKGTLSSTMKRKRFLAW